MKLDVVLVVVGPEEATDVLDHPALEGDRESEEQGVELGPVEPSPR